MIRVKRLLACAALAFVVLGSGCDSQGIGMSVPSSGARWGGGGSTPDVLVAGGPVYR